MSATTIKRIGTMTAQPDKGDELAAFAREIIMPALQMAEGCLSCELLRSQSDPNTIMIIEHWTSEAHHQASVKHIRPEDIQRVMGLLAGAPAGGYYHSLTLFQADHAE